MGTQKTRSDNPLRDHNKRNTQERSDHADPTEPRTPVEETVTGQGGSTKGGGPAHSDHPSQRGGVKHDLPEHPRPPTRRHGEQH